MLVQAAVVDWAERARQVAAWQASGLNERDWCMREGLVYERFRYWRKALRQQSRKSGMQEGVTGFVPVVVSPEVSVLEVVLTSPGGWQVRLPLAGQSLLAVLRQLP